MLVSDQPPTWVKLYAPEAADNDSDQAHQNPLGQRAAEPSREWNSQDPAAISLIQDPGQVSFSHSFVLWRL
jgi:hypothetical protein